jgi:flagellar protein FlbD
MIHLTRLNQLPLVVNADLIEHIEMTPDTVIFLTTGQKILVRESANEIIEKVIYFRHSLLEGTPRIVDAAAGAGCPPAADNGRNGE